MKDNFVHLHLHSTYSLQDGVGLPEQYVKRAVELGQPGLAVTDHGNVSSHYKWYKECNKLGITPLLGCEMYIVKDYDSIRERKYNHVTLLAKNNIGYNNLMKLVTKAWCDQFYYKPRITWQNLFEHQEGIIVLSGCLGSPIMEPLKNKDLSDVEAERQSKEIIELFAKNITDYYIEFQPITFPEGKSAYNRLIHLYETELKSTIKGVVTSDCHYVTKEQNVLQEILLCIQSRDKMSNPNRWKFDQDDFFLKSRDEMEQSMKECFPQYDFSKEMDETVNICNSIDFTFPKAEPIKFPIPDDEKVEYFRKLCNEGMIKRGFYDETKLPYDTKKEKIYKERLEYEIDLIVKKDFVDYFLAVNDMVVWAKDSGILVGPARGSAAGSLVCYALRITEVDPIRYDLIFQRFIDINREDLPDIDVDFEDVRRDEVKEYLSNKYGADKVGNIPVFAEFKGKSAVIDIGRVYQIPFSVMDKIKPAIIERSGGDSRASFTLEDTFNSTVFEYPKQALKKYPELAHAIGLEGQIRNMGQHASGFMISNELVTNFCSFYKTRGTKMISLAYKDAADVGLIKFDLLGLNTLTVVTKCLKLIKERHKKSIDIYNIPLDDPKVYKAFCKGKLFGIFQFDGQAVNQVCRQIQPKDFDALSAISALARPGPLNSGNTTEYIQRRNGKKKVTYVHPIMESITQDSYGIVIYQEQVMRIMREIGEMSWKDTSEIRKLISRSQGVEKFNTFKDKFMPGALKNGLKQKEADKIWEEMCSYGSWSFNKSHSVSYTVISYWTQWLKVYYPMEFYCAILSLANNAGKKKSILKEYKKEGYKILPVDINKSKESFTIDKEGLRIGFEEIKGIGETVSKKVINNQPYVSYTDFCSRTSRISEKVKQNFVNLGAFDSLGVNGAMMTLFGELAPEFYKRELTFEEKIELCPWDVEFGVDKNWLQWIKDRPDKFKQLPINIEDLKQEEGSEDVVIYGIVYDKNLRDVAEVSSSKGKAINLNDFRIAELKSYRAKMMFENSKYTSQKAIAYKRTLIEGEDYTLVHQPQFANFVIEDDTDFITARLSQIKFPDYGKLIFEQTKPDDVLIIRGKMGSGIRMFFVNKIINLRLLKEQEESKII